MTFRGHSCAGNLSPAMGARNQVGIGLSYRPASLCSLATQFRTRFLESIPRPTVGLKFSTLGCFLVPWLQREATSYKESISWNRMPWVGSQMVKRFLNVSSIFYHRFCNLHCFCMQFADSVINIATGAQIQTNSLSFCIFIIFFYFQRDLWRIVFM